MTTAVIAALAAFVASSSPLSTPVSDTARASGVEMSQFMPEPRRPIVCTQQYDPVCGRIGNVTRTFSNACVARAAGAEIVAKGPCGD